MFSKVYHVEVFTCKDEKDRECISIHQPVNGEAHVIYISPDQLDLFIEHLKEAQEEIYSSTSGV